MASRHNGLENPHCVRLLKKLCKSSKRWLKRDNPLGGVLFYKSKFLVSFTWDGKQRWQYVRVRKWSVYCTSPQIIPGPQMIPDRKWSPNWTANDPGPQVIPILDRKWSRPKNKEWHGLILKWHTKNIFLFYKKYSILVIFLFFFFFGGKSVTLRDFLFCLFQDLLRFTVIDFVKVLVP